MTEVIVPVVEVTSTEPLSQMIQIGQLAANVSGVAVHVRVFLTISFILSYINDILEWPNNAEYACESGNWRRTATNNFGNQPTTIWTTRRVYCFLQFQSTI
jgi:hypothetical protein